MTIIASPALESTTRDRQRAVALALADLLTLPTPEVCTWEISHGDIIRGQLAGAPTIDQTRIALHQWAAVLDNPTWEYKPYRTSPGHAGLALSGSYQGQRVTIWNGIQASPGLTVDELSTSPVVDAAEQAEAVA